MIDDAEDVVQEAMLRAFMYFDGFRGGDARSWVLKIVRNTCFTWLQTNRPSEIAAMAAEELEERRRTGLSIPDLLTIPRRSRFVGRPLFSSMMRSPPYRRHFGRSWFYVRWKDFPTRKLPLSSTRRSAL